MFNNKFFNRAKRLLLLGAMTFTVTVPLSSWADTAWPNGPVKIIVPFGPGGNTDIIARLMADRFSRELNATFIVENRPGAGGQIASGYVARAKPDGQTLYMTTMSQIVSQPLIQEVRYDPINDFDPLINVGGNAFVLAVNPRRGFENLSDLIKFGKENPGELNVAHAGVGAFTHLSALMFLNEAKIEAESIPYKGGASALIDVISGQSDVYSASPSEIMHYVDKDDLSLLGISSSERLEQLPNVPTIAEFFPNYAVETWNGIVGPAGMPNDTKEKIAEVGKKIIMDPNFQKELASLGIVPYGETSDDFAARIKGEIEVWAPIIKEANITIN